MTAWRIKDWGEYRGKHRLFECAQSSKYEKPAWLPLPINLTGERFRVLMADRDGQAAFGVFVSLCEVAAHCPVKGALLTCDGALSLRALRARTGIPEADLEAAIAFLSAEEIGWLKPVSDRQVRRLIGRIKREASGSNLGALSETEQEQDKEQEQDRDEELNPALQDGGSHAKGPRLALASPASPDPRVESALHQFWRTKTFKARTLAQHPNATLERVTWLVWRARTEGVARKAGFIEKGIVEGWPVDAEWLRRRAGVAS